MVSMTEREIRIGTALNGRALSMDIDQIAAAIGMADDPRCGTGLTATLRAMQRKCLVDSFGPVRAGGRVKWMLTARGKAEIEEQMPQIAAE